MFVKNTMGLWLNIMAITLIVTSSYGIYKNKDWKKWKQWWLSWKARHRTNADGPS